MVKAMNNRNLIIVVIFVVLVVLLGAFAFTHTQTKQDTKVNTEITFLSKNTLKNGEAVQFELKEKDGNAIPGQNITICFLENGENQTYSIVTDGEGKGSLVLNNEMPGSYEVTVSYNGTATYKECSASQTITIEEGVSETQSDDSSSESGSSQPVQTNSSAGTSLYNGNSSSQGQLYYDSQYNFYYDDNGIIRGGQNDGYSADYIRNSYESGNMIDEDGNLQ